MKNEKNKKIFLKKKISKFNCFDKKNIFISLLLIVFLTGFTIFFVMQNRTVSSFKIEDRCGEIANMISHTIENEQVCEIRCSSQCESRNLRIKRYEFVFNPIGCHNCTCFCR